MGLTGVLAGCQRAPDNPELLDEPVPGPAAEAPSFALAVYPLQRQAGLRFLVDARKRPFLFQGDSAWSILVQLTREEAEVYLADRQRRGFNTILVNLLEHKYSADAPRNRYGHGPFRIADDYGTPNDDYFDHAAWLVRAAADKGMLVLLAATYIGCCGDGWYAQMVATGPARMREYGRFLGRRFREFDNIMWVHGGDANPVDQSIVGEVALGIREVDTVKLHTAHTAPGFQARDVYPTAPWLDVNNIYTYDTVKSIAWRAYGRGEPFFLLESEYEGENRHAPHVRLRAQAWQAMLGGATGQLFGNNPIWHFASPRPITPFKGTWQEALDSETARSMTQLRRLFDTIDWWRLEPDRDRSFLTAGACDGHYGAVAARFADGQLAVVYAPLRRQIRVNLDRMKPGPTRLSWYDPVSGRFGPRFTVSNKGQSQSQLPPGQVNAGGDTDWVLLIQSGA